MQQKTWGGRFTKALDPKASQFNASLAFDHVLFEDDIKGSIAHAKMLALTNIITKEEAEKICTALKKIDEEIKNNQYAFSDEYEDIHMFIEHLLTQKIGEAGKKLHTGRSRNDQVALDLRLYIREAAEKVEASLIDFSSLLKDLATKHAEDEMPGYTHLQQAQPITLGKYFGAYFSMFTRDKMRIFDFKKRMNFSPLGAGALAGSTLPLDREFIAKELGFDGIIENTIDAVSDRDFVIEFCSTASIIMVHLSRLAEDLIIWATQEFSFIELDDAFATGSSLMPNKKNPDILELIRGKSGRVFGHLVGILTVMKGLPLAYNKDMQEDKEGLIDTANTVLSCLKIITPFLKSLKFNIKIMKEKATGGFLDATAMVEKLVLDGIPFRDAHHMVGEMVAKAIEQNKTLKETIANERKGYSSHKTQ